MGRFGTDIKIQLLYVFLTCLYQGFSFALPEAIEIKSCFLNSARNKLGAL